MIYSWQLEDIGTWTTGGEAATVNTTGAVRLDEGPVSKTGSAARRLGCKSPGFLHNQARVGARGSGPPIPAGRGRRAAWSPAPGHRGSARRSPGLPWSAALARSSAAAEARAGRCGGEGSTSFRAARRAPAAATTRLPIPARPGLTPRHAPVVNWLSSLVVNQQYGDRNPVGAP